ncbi:hypothetical protein ACFFQW_28965 [Umezawaea endophytica]|uniref:Uncharacterized protein n=1 Tax=Umezawaea endophytica TaxID=1654476 RepID=A0A9X2VWZ2_9PSEU|nr:hypothetical protein [Umezawaea endophytica]MCS7484136.1 hypothetical protein [Umezawaea endophytica]
MRFSATTGSTAVLDRDWNDHYMWVETRHKGWLAFEVYLTPAAVDVVEVELVDAEELLA